MCLVLQLLQEQIGKKDDKRDRNEGALQENDEQFPEVERDFALDDDGAHFRYVNDLDQGQHADDEAGLERLHAGNQQCGNEHIGEADQSRRGNCKGFLNAEQL